MIRISFAALVLLGSISVHADIYKCEDPEGNVAYMQTPCPVEKKEAAEPVAQPEPDTLEEPAQEPQAPVADNRSHEEVEACKDPLRDSIDEIEAEMLRGYSAERGEEFKEELRTLTEEMRACG